MHRPGQVVPDLDHAIVVTYVNRQFDPERPDVCQKDTRTGRFPGRSPYYTCRCKLLKNLKNHGKQPGRHQLFFFISHGGMNARGETYITADPLSTCQCKKTNLGTTTISEILANLRQVTTGATVVIMTCREYLDPTHPTPVEFARRPERNTNVIWVGQPGNPFTAGSPVDAFKEAILKAYEETRTPYATINLLSQRRQDGLKFIIDRATNLLPP